jgi:hypothetical protein
MRMEISWFLWDICYPILTATGTGYYTQYYWHLCSFERSGHNWCAWWHKDCRLMIEWKRGECAAACMVLIEMCVFIECGYFLFSWYTCYCSWHVIGWVLSWLINQHFYTVIKKSESSSFSPEGMRRRLQGQTKQTMHERMKLPKLTFIVDNKKSHS